MFCYLHIALAVQQTNFSSYMLVTSVLHLGHHSYLPGIASGLPDLSHVLYYSSYDRPRASESSSLLTQNEAFKRTDQDVIDFYARNAATPIPNVPKFDSRRVVDGQRKITFHKPLPTTSTGKHFEVRSKVLGVYDKGKAGTVVETEQVVAEKGGDVYSRAVGSGFFVGQGNWGGPKGNPDGA